MFSYSKKIIYILEDVILVNVHKKDILMESAKKMDETILIQRRSMGEDNAMQFFKKGSISSTPV